MKRKLTLLATVAAVALTTHVGSPVLAQGPNGQPAASAAPVSKIAVVNLQAVVKQYDKWKQFEASYKTQYQNYDGQFEKMKAEGLSLKTKLGTMKPDDPEADNIKKRLREMDAQVANLGDEAKKQLGKMQDDMSVQIYKEIEEAVQYYARAQGIEMVFHFNDAVVPAEIYNPMNIQRKLQTGAAMPMYVTPGLEITNYIAEMLNTRYRKMMNPNAGR